MNHTNSNSPSREDILRSVVQEDVFHVEQTAREVSLAVIRLAGFLKTPGLLDWQRVGPEAALDALRRAARLPFAPLESEHRNLKPDAVAVRVLNGEERGHLLMREALRRPLGGPVPPLTQAAADRHLEKVRERLRAYASTWTFQSPTFGAWEKANPRQAAAVRRAVAQLRLRVDVFPDGLALLAQRSPAGRPDIEAARLFLSIAAGPRPEAFRGCRREECRRYFLATTKRKRAYCSPPCARHVSATTATDRKRKREFAGRLEHHRKLIEEWNRRKRRRGNPREWIKARGGSLHFLTRHEGEELPELVRGD